MLTAAYLYAQHDVLTWPKFRLPIHQDHLAFEVESFPPCGCAVVCSLDGSGVDIALYDTMCKSKSTETTVSYAQNFGQG